MRAPPEIPSSACRLLDTTCWVEVAWPGSSTTRPTSRWVIHNHGLLSEAGAVCLLPAHYWCRTGLPDAQYRRESGVLVPYQNWYENFSYCTWLEYSSAQASLPTVQYAWYRNSVVRRPAGTQSFFWSTSTSTCRDSVEAWRIDISCGVSRLGVST